MEKRKSEKNNDVLVLILLVPILLLVTIATYKTLVNFAKNNPRACNFLGRVWLAGVPGDPNVRKGCFTYEELYSEE